jgi:diguanylate cyclase (GGDEF)-like protein
MLSSRKPSLIGAFLARHLFPDHCPIAHLAKVVDADDLREHLRVDYDSGAHTSCILMLDIDSFHLINRDFGKREGDRVLQAVTQVLLLNLRSTDLLCRYAGDRFAVLLPGTQPEAAHALADHLRRAVASLRHHAHRSGLPITSTIRYTFRNVDAEPRQLLKELNRALERRVPVTPGGTEMPAGAAVRA